MVNAQYGLRTWTRLGISRYATISGERVKIPMGVITAPGTMSIQMGESIEELKTKSCKGQTVTAFTYSNEIAPEIQLECSVASPEWDTFVHGRLMAAGTNVEGFAYFELDATKTSFPARTSGQTGFGVTAQSASDYSEIYYIDPVTKLAQPLEIVASSPANDQIVIGNNLAITLSPELADTGYRIEGWVPVTLSAATIISAELLDVVEIKAQGIDFNEKVAGFRARYCTRLAGGEINQDPARQANFRILEDPNDGTGIGFQMFYPNLEVVC
ncbi:hypothetical protein [Aulosira sp. FACHB-615]|uniref:hypothetical protein n=1 Tax=Aulosira sp. FACHB-615 TaxID=2692777 RepID=UPI001681F28A|nr:hypothetical protein [Aulosira sp. FACHB-615]MBD2492477.1 hypothetical protein [Aulosira sp. FACHB-615]